MVSFMSVKCNTVTVVILMAFFVWVISTDPNWLCISTSCYTITETLWAEKIMPLETLSWQLWNCVVTAVSHLVFQPNQISWKPSERWAIPQTLSSHSCYHTDVLHVSGSVEQFSTLVCCLTQALLLFLWRSNWNMSQRQEPVKEHGKRSWLTLRGGEHAIQTNRKDKCVDLQWLCCGCQSAAEVGGEVEGHLEDRGWHHSERVSETGDGEEESHAAHQRPV